MIDSQSFVCSHFLHIESHNKKSFSLLQGKFIRVHFGPQGKIAGADIEFCKRLNASCSIPCHSVKREEGEGGGGGGRGEGKKGWEKRG